MDKKLSPKIYVLVALIVLLLIITAYYFLVAKDSSPENIVNDFESCAAAGNPILESYPEQCVHEGQSYTRLLSEDEKKNLLPPEN